MPIIKNPKIPLLHKVIITAISSLLVLLIIWPSEKEPPLPVTPSVLDETENTSSLPQQSQDTQPKEGDTQDDEEKKEITYKGKLNSLNWRLFKIKSGENLAILFDRVGISPTTLHNLILTDEHTKDLASLKIGDEIQLGFDGSGKLSQLIQPISASKTLIVTRENNKFESKIENKKVESQLNFATATITSNFWNAGIKAELNANQVLSLGTIFGWDIDFALDLRKGDSFSVLYEESLVDGVVISKGHILAATVTSQGETFTAVRTKSGQYYDENGRAMRKAFLRSPVNFRYVSSNFNPKRLHPVTGKIKAHKGTDYVAPVGTPIWAAGDGVVSESGFNQYNGNYVFIRHNKTYVTKYLHLTKRFVKTNERVKQGDKIGTLGGTGRVTGPHLHYEFLVNGVHKNPRTVQLPQSQSLSGETKRNFIALAKQRLEKLKEFNAPLAKVATEKK